MQDTLQLVLVEYYYIVALVHRILVEDSSRRKIAQIEQLFNENVLYILFTTKVDAVQILRNT